MSTLKAFISGTLLGAGLVFVALQYHVVQSRDGFRVVPRSPQHALGLAYVDVRQWDTENYADRPELVKALVEHGSTDLVADSVAGNVMESAVPFDAEGSIDQLRDFLRPADSQSVEADRTGSSGFFQDTEFPRLPEQNELDFDEPDFTIPFPREARESRRPAVETARRNERRTIPERATVAGSDRRQQNRAPIDDIFGAGTGRLGALQNPQQLESPERPRTRSNNPPVPQPTAPAPTAPRPARDDDTLERMLFGDDDTPRNLDRVEDEGFGVFEEVTSALEENAVRALHGLDTSGSQQPSQIARNPAGAADRFVRELTRDVLPDPIDSLRRAASIGSNADSDMATPLPPELRAIRDGFDPFAR